MRLVILCEGFTEKKVLKAFLEPYCTGFSHVSCTTPSGQAGSGRLKQEFKKLAETELEVDPNAVVLCLIDLLQAPFTYPKAVENDSEPYLARAAYVKQYMEDAVDSSVRNRFFAFPVVMELETWLLADPEALNTFFRTNDIRGWHSPEMVAHPSGELKMLMNRFRSRDYSKTLYGAQLFELAQAERIYDDNCPHFEVIVNKLLELQGIAQSEAEPRFAVPDAELYGQLHELYQACEHHFDDCDRRGEMTEADVQIIENIETQIAQVNDRITEKYRQTPSE